MKRSEDLQARETRKNAERKSESNRQGNAASELRVSLSLCVSLSCAALFLSSSLSPHVTLNQNTVSFLSHHSSLCLCTLSSRRATRVATPSHKRTRQQERRTDAARRTQHVTRTHMNTHSLSLSLCLSRQYHRQIKGKERGACTAVPSCDRQS